MLDYVFPLLAQVSDAAKTANNANNANFWIALGLFLVATIPSYLLGVGLAKYLRVPEYGKRLGYIFVTIGLAIVVVCTATPKFGIDLRGGVILVYEIDQQSTAAANDESSVVTVQELVSALGPRLNPGGVNEIQIRAYGDRQVEVIVPDVSDEEKESIKRKIANAGQLEFLILANDPDKDDAINMVLNDPSLQGERFIRNADDKLIGQWARVHWGENPKTKRKELSVHNTSGYFRNAATGELIPEARSMDQENFEAFLAAQGIENIDSLMAVDPDPEYRVSGTELSSASTSTNEVGSYIIRFSMTSTGSNRMGNLTGANTSDPQRGYYRYLGIVLDGNLRSAPSVNSRIEGSGEISGRFSRAEVGELVDVLRAGKLPAVLQKTPISENQISPLLGRDTIEKGTMSMIISIVAVLFFMIIYYRFAGVVACFALLMNTLLVVAIMFLIQAAFTLPGLAGMVLTVGMAVDANVLIFERIREELARGAVLRMAIRNGFSRAMTTIVDSNLTTIITAVVLYVIGTEQLKGFAVTLILGILMSMFTAIYVARVIFDIAERRRFITTLSMMDWWGKSNIDFIRLYWPTTVASIVLIVVGLAAIVYRGKQLFDTDFNGGTSVEMLLAKPLPENEVRSRVARRMEAENHDYTVTRIDVTGRPVETLYKIDTSIQDVNELETTLEELFKSESGESLLATNRVAISPVSLVTEPVAAPAKQPAEKPLELGPKQPAPTPTDETPDAIKLPADAPDVEKPAEPAPDAPAPEETKPEETKPEESNAETSPEESQVFRFDVPSTLVAQATDPVAETPTEAASTGEEPAETKPAEAAPAEVTPAAPVATEPATTAPPAGTAEAPAETEPAAEVAAPARSKSQATLTFETAINAPTLYVILHDSARELVAQKKLDLRYQDADSTRPEWVKVRPDPLPDGWSDDSSLKAKVWVATLDAPLADTQLLVQAVQEHVAETTVWNSSSKIGGKVAEKTRFQAIYAMLASLIGVMAYVWFRFHRLMYGIAAIVALFHDVLVTVGLIALSTWLAPIFGFLLIEEFKISLTVIAAILTLIGYSLNDTIVTFDRIREVKGKSPHLTPDMINRSINETLSRTFLTAGTTLIVVLILYTLGGSGIHGFAFSMLVGVIAGTYSSVFIAAPLLLWMRGPENVPQKAKPAKAKV